MVDQDCSDGVDQGFIFGSLVDIKNNVFLGGKKEDDVKGVAEEGGPEGEGSEKKLLENNRLKRRL